MTDTVFKMQSHDPLPLDIVKYANLLTTCMKRGLKGHEILQLVGSIEWERGILQKAAHDVDCLGDKTWINFHSMKKIVAAMMVVVKTRLAIALEHQRECAESVSRIDIQPMFAECAALSANGLWRAMCMMALLEGDTIDDLHSTFSEPFTVEHRTTIVTAAAMLGDLAFLTRSAASWDPSERLALAPLIVPAAAIHGKPEIFEKILELFPADDGIISVAREKALLFNQDKMFKHLLETSLRRKDRPASKGSIVRSTFLQVGAIGGPSAMMELCDAYPHLAQGHRLAPRCLELATKHENLPMIRFLLGKTGYPFSGVTPDFALLIACERGKLAIVKELFRVSTYGHRIYPSIELARHGNMKLRLAIARNHINVVKYLLRATKCADGSIRFVLPEAAACCRDESLIDTAILHERAEIYRFLESQCHLAAVAASSGVKSGETRGPSLGHHDEKDRNVRCRDAMV